MVEKVVCTSCLRDQLLTFCRNKEIVVAIYVVGTIAIRLLTSGTDLEDLFPAHRDHTFVVIGIVILLLIAEEPGQDLCATPHGEAGRIWIRPVVTNHNGSGSSWSWSSSSWCCFVLVSDLFKDVVVVFPKHPKEDRRIYAVVVAITLDRNSIGIAADVVIVVDVRFPPFRKGDGMHIATSGWCVTIVGVAKSRGIGIAFCGWHSAESCSKVQYWNSLDVKRN